MQFFDDLGSVVETRWRDKDYNEQLFPEIAATAIAEADCVNRIDPWDVIRYLHSNYHLPHQEDDDFSDLPLTLYRGPRFSIEVYYWLDGTTAIHQHGFAGAFHVLLGSSIHSSYSFANERKINARFSVGQVILEQVELLGQGAIRQINPGRSFVHSLFHLDRPSVTITVRTYSAPSAKPQYAYLSPSIALDPFYKEPGLKKKLQSVRLLLRMNHPESDSLIADLISASDFQTTFSVLKTVFESSSSEQWNPTGDASTGHERFLKLLEVARRKHGDLADILHPVFTELRRKSALVAKRKQITSSEHRFFLALLLNVPDRARVLELVEHFSKEDPVITVLRWMKELSSIKTLRTADATADAFSEMHLFALESLLRGGSVSEVERRLDERYASLYGQQRVQAEFENLRAFLKSSILQPLFSEAPSLSSEIPERRLQTAATQRS